MKAKRTLSLLLSVLFVLTLLPGLALPVRAEEVDAGDCGENALWSLDSEGILTISRGHGEEGCWMDDYSETAHAPWYDCRASVRRVVLEEGVNWLGDYAFDGCAALEEVSISDNLWHVGNWAFRGCDSLREIQVSSENEDLFSDGGVLLGYDWDVYVYCYPPAKEDVYYCLPENTDGYCFAPGAFAGAKHLERLYIPEISGIVPPVFPGCENLAKLYYGGSPEDLEDWENDLRADLPREDAAILCYATAEDCVNDAEIRICGENALWDLDSEGTLTIFPADETEDSQVDNYDETMHAPWYERRASIRRVKLEEGVRSLGDYAFDGCSALEEVSLPVSLRTVGDWAFRDCDSLREIRVSEGSTSFNSDGGVLLGDNSIYRYPPAREDEYYCLPEDTWGSIRPGAFAGAKHLERLYIPEISDISFPAFEGCENLTKLYLGGDASYMVYWEEELRSDLPGDVTILYNVTAEDCQHNVDGNSCGENLIWKVENGTLTISGTGPMTDYGEFDPEEESWWLRDPPWWDWIPGGDKVENREQITRLVVEEGVTSIGIGAFRDLSCLETVELPSTLTAIGGWAFDSDTALKRVEIPAGVTVIPDSAFSSSGLKEVVLPDSVRVIESWAFGETELEEIDLPAGLTEIGPWAFYYTPLKRVEIPAGVSFIGERAFYECYDLAEFEVDEANPAYRSIGGALFSKDGTEMISYGAGHTASSYTVPEGVRKLHPSTFSYSHALEEVNLPDSLEELGNWCFGHTGLKQVIVPAHVSTIEHSAFGGCENLTTVTLPARLRVLEDWVFSGDEALREIFFEGSEEKWAALTAEHEDETLQNVTVHCNVSAYCSHESLIRHPAVPHGCLTDGVIEYWECRSCGGLFSDARAKKWVEDLTDPAAHDYRSVLTLAPTCREAGVRTWTCAVCDENTEGHSYTQTIPATGRHHFVDGYCDNLLQDGVTLCGAPEQIASGELEGGFSWSIDGGGTLHIRGEGDMPDTNLINHGSNTFSTDAPWWDYRNAITAVRLHSGVASVGNGCFAGLGNMKSLYVPVTVTDMSAFWTFFQCNDLSDVYYEGTREQWSSMHLFANSILGNIIEIRNPFGSGMLRVVDYIGRTTKHYEYDPDRTCTVTWQNWDGSVLETDEGVLPGTAAEYDDPEPVRDADDRYTYIFDGWTPEPAEVTEDTVYTARFRAEPLPAVPVTQITLVSIEGAAEGQPIPAGDFTLALTVELAEGIAPETVQILAAAYSEAGQFLGCFQGTLTRQADGSCAVNVAVENQGNTDRLHILVLSGAGWIPLAAAAELR